MNLQAEPPEKKKTKNSSPPSLSSIPEEITVSCLARISRAYYPTISVVSKTFHSLVSSTKLYEARSHLGSTEQCIYVCLWDEGIQPPQWFTLWVNPKRTLPDSTTKKRKKAKRNRQLLAPINSSNFRSLSGSTIVVGSEIYVIGGPIKYKRSSAVQVLDCRSHTWRDAPSMNAARKNGGTCFYDGKIYVMGGCLGVEGEPWAEVFDIKTQTWERLTDPGTEIRNSHLRTIAEVQGKIHFRSFLENNRLRSHGYDPNQGKWESCKGPLKFPESECVMDGVGYNIDMRLLSKDLQSTDGCWRDVKGLDSLTAKYMRNGGSLDNTTKLVCCGGKLYLIWQGNMSLNPNIMKKIWCAEIDVEKRNGGEVWGNVQWVEVVRSVPSSCDLLHCLVVSV